VSFRPIHWKYQRKRGEKSWTRLEEEVVDGSNVQKAMST